MLRPTPKNKIAAQHNHIIKIARYKLTAEAVEKA